MEYKKHRFILFFSKLINHKIKIKWIFLILILCIIFININPIIKSTKSILYPYYHQLLLPSPYENISLSSKILDKLKDYKISIREPYKSPPPPRWEAIRYFNWYI